MDAAAFCLFVVLCLVGLVVFVRQQWSGDAPLFEPVWWPLGATLWRVYARTLVLHLLYMVTVLPLATFMKSPAIAAVGLVVLGVPALAIALVNRPQAFVPPSQRDDPGLLHIWLRVLRRRRG